VPFGQRQRRPSPGLAAVPSSASVAAISGVSLSRSTAIRYATEWLRLELIPIQVRSYYSAARQQTAV
jgi:hypothetical protein